MFITYMIETTTGAIVDAGVDNEFIGDEAINHLITYLKQSFKENPSLIPQITGDPGNPSFLLVIEKRADKKDADYIFRPKPFTYKEIEKIRKKLPNFTKTDHHKLTSDVLLLIKTRGRFTIKAKSHPSIK